MKRQKVTLTKDPKLGQGRLWIDRKEVKNLISVTTISRVNGSTMITAKFYADDIDHAEHEGAL